MFFQVQQGVPRKLLNQEEILASTFYSQGVWISLLFKSVTFDMNVFLNCVALHLKNNNLAKFIDLVISKFYRATVENFGRKTSFFREQQSIFARTILKI